MPSRNNRQRLIVVGAGPKGVGIAAKHAVLGALGWQVPEVVVVDEIGVGANWTGQNGYTDGRQLLGTLPEKDVGFPYRSDQWGSANQAVNQRMLQLSWDAHLMAGAGEGAMTYASWIDRGRPQPSHRQWADYLRWVADQVGLDLRIGRVTRIDLLGGRWRLTCERDGRPDWVEGDGLVITGPGKPRGDIPGYPSALPPLTDGQQLWRERHRFRDVERPMRICVVGSGETAAAAVVGLLEVLPAGSSIDICSRQGVAYSRGESFEENHLYSNPGEWASLTAEHRSEFVRRTDRGVFSVHANSVLAQAQNVRTMAGEVVRLDAESDQVEVHVEYSGRRRVLRYDYVVVATGFDPLWFEPLLTDRARVELAAALGGTGELAIKHSIEHDLAVHGLHPRLHLPMLAGLEQGPGFPNLSCLGLLSDRILRPYCRPPQVARPPFRARSGLAPLDVPKNGQPAGEATTAAVTA
ncbi:MAG TPA: SidA/IucD/PvdA family monooxygenase [Pseudonocardiaceae bacterium]|jgi:mycobactin lysine-N-oxygenase|nr:SidA/IucD/PvdA family monooxygenase [Pseudonocardiaceae bacterium]